MTGKHGDAFRRDALQAPNWDADRGDSGPFRALKQVGIHGQPESGRRRGAPMAFVDRVHETLVRGEVIFGECTVTLEASSKV